MEQLNDAFKLLLHIDCRLFSHGFMCWDFLVFSRQLELFSFDESQWNSLIAYSGQTCIVIVIFLSIAFVAGTSLSFVSCLSISCDQSQ